MENGKLQRNHGRQYNCVRIEGKRIENIVTFTENHKILLEHCED